MNEVTLPEGVSVEAVAMIYGWLSEEAQFRFPGEAGVLEVAAALEYIVGVMRESVAETNAELQKDAQ